MQQGTAPGKTLTIADAVFVVVGIVVGAGIFKTPSLVAANAGSGLVILAMWLAGGVASLTGALTYAELAAAYPTAGGDYHFLARAMGGRVSFLYAWARMTVIQTGSIAMISFIIGDYATGFLPLGTYSATWYAVLSVLALTAANAAGIRPGMIVQKTFLTAIVIGLITVSAAAIGIAGSPTPAAASADPGTTTVVGRAMIFVLLTYGGWNEAAFLSAEVFGSRRSMVAVMILSIAAITGIYLMVNAAFIAGIGHTAMASSEVIAADVVGRVLGSAGAAVVSILVIVAAVSTMNGVIITGARTNFALGRDHTLFSFLGKWRERSGTPVNALLFQGAIALALVLIGTLSRGGFTTMVDYTAPVYWLFMLLVTLSLFILRMRDPDAERPYRVPFYPVTPLLFGAVCAYMLYASLSFTGAGALLGVAVLALGTPFLLPALRGGR